jgi:zinc protease
VKPLHLTLAAAGLLAAAAAHAQRTPPSAPPRPVPHDTTPRPAVRQSPPPAMAARPMRLPAHTEATLPNGLRLLVVENHARPMASVDLYVPGGTAADPAGKLGLATMEAELLTKGTPTRTAKQIAEQIEGVGGSLDASAADDYVVLSTSVLSDQAGLAFDLLSDAALHASFPDEELQTARTRALSTLQAALGQPATIASRAFYSRVYGSHPYGHLRTPATVQAITRADLQQYHGAYFTPRNALLVVAGDVTPARARELATRYFGSWTGAAAPAVAFPAPPAAGPTQIVLVHRPGSVQSNVVVGNLGIRPANPDRYALVVANQVLGGGADSRLFEILRQQKGWTYGAYSSVSRPRDVGLFSATAEVRTEVTDSALAEMLKQIQRIRGEPVSAAELGAATSYLVGSYPLKYETPGQLADRLALNRVLGLPDAELTDYPARVGAVTPAAVQRAAQQYLKPENLTVVVVGDASKVLSRLRAIGPVTLVDVQGRPIDPASLEVPASTDRFDASRLAPAVLTYGVVANGNAVASITSTVARDGQNWVVTQAIPGGTSEVRFTSDLTPVSMHQVIGGGMMEVTLAYANGRVTGHAKLPAQAGGEKDVDAAVVAGTRFSGMEPFAAVVSDLAAGKVISLPVFSARSGSVSNVTLTVSGSESVTVPAGTFDTWKVDIAGGENGTTVWVRKDMPHWVVKQTVAGQPVTIELRSIK